MYEIEFDHRRDVEVLAWCREQFGHNLIHDDRAFGVGWYREITSVDGRIVESIVFNRKQDAVLFALRWA